MKRRQKVMASTPLPRAFGCLMWRPGDRAKYGSQRRAIENRSRTLQRIRARRIAFRGQVPSKVIQRSAITSATTCAQGPQGGSSVAASGPVESFTCVKCLATFELQSSEKEWYLCKGLTPPKKCPGCRRGGSTSQARKANAGLCHGSFTASGHFPGAAILWPGGKTIAAIREAHGVQIHLDFENKKLKFKRVK